MDGAQLTSWYEVAKGEVPLPLTGPSLNLSPLPAPHPPTIFLFGGKLVVQRRLTAEMWAFDINSRTWSRVNAGKGPGARYFHSMDTWEDKLVCFGGMADNDPHSEKLNVHNDVWMFDCRSRRWLPQPSPEAPIGSFVPDDETIHASPPPTPSAIQDPELLPTPRYAHLSAISRGKLMVCGGQRMDNSWIYEMNVYDLKRNIWVSKTEQPVSHGLHSKGAYRSATASSPYRVIVPPGDSNTITGAPTLPYTVDEEGSGGDIWCYSNYDFAKVRRELEVLSPLDGDDDQTPSTSEKYASPPGFTMKDLSNKVNGSSQPPGLRFPTGAIIGNHFVLCGLYLASTSAAFSIWTLNLTNHTWKHIEPPALATGSWNIVVLDPISARLLIFGNAQSDLAVDYSKRAVSLNHVAIIELEAFGVYQAPRLLLSEKTQDMGLAMLDEKLVSDFEVVCDDGRKIKCSRKLLAERWPWFAEQQAALIGKAGDIVQEMPSMDINDALLGSMSPARFTPNRLHLPEPLPVCVALIQYFYTLNLTTPLQARAPVLCALLFISKQYKIERLNKLVVHALHCRLEPSNAIHVYEVAALAAEQNLAARALAMVNPKSSSSSRHHHRRPGSSMPNSEGGGTSTTGSASTGGTATAASAQGTTNASQTPNTPTAPGGAAPADTHEMSRSPSTPLQPLRRSSEDDHMMTRSPSAPVRRQSDTLSVNTLEARTRQDSFTCPEDVMDGRGGDMDEPDSQAVAVNQLLDALDISAPPPIRIPHRPSPLNISQASMSSRPSSRCSSYSSVSSRARRGLPPMMPPPERPLPFRPDNMAQLSPIDDHRSYRSYSPTSDTTSIYPRTPSESTRNSRDSSFLRDSRDSTFMRDFGRDHSPTGPTLAERRQSQAGTPTKVLPALLEDELLLDSGSETYSDADDMPGLEVTVTTAPIDGDLGGQQNRAMESMQHDSSTHNKLMRAVSLNSINVHARTPPRASLDSHLPQVNATNLHSRRAVESIHNIPISDKSSNLLPPRPEVGHVTNNAVDVEVEQSESEEDEPVPEPPRPNLTPSSSYASSSKSRPMSLIMPHQPVLTEQEEQERLLKFQAFIAEQQRGLGISSAEADDLARRAMGKAGQTKGRKLGRLGAKFADALLF